MFKKAKIFHCDLKPDNIIILKSEDKDGCFQYKLIDFDSSLQIKNDKDLLKYGKNGKTNFFFDITKIEKGFQVF